MILNTKIWKAVVDEAKAKASNSPLWLTAIDRAVVEIEKARYWSFADNTLTIESTSSRTLYRIGDDHKCEATAFNRPCKHRAARRLMALYFESLGNVAPVADEAPAVAPAIAAMRQRQAERDASVLVMRYEGKRTYCGAIEI